MICLFHCLSELILFHSCRTRPFHRRVAVSKGCKCPHLHSWFMFIMFGYAFSHHKMIPVPFLFLYCCSLIWHSTLFLKCTHLIISFQTFRIVLRPLQDPNLRYLNSITSLYWLSFVLKLLTWLTFVYFFAQAALRAGICSIFDRMINSRAVAS